jgi:hypothetical protein
MPVVSREKTIRQLIETQIYAAIPEITFSYDPVSIDDIPSDQFPHCVILVDEEEPERLPFKQERRRVVVESLLAYIIDAGVSAETAREIVKYPMQVLRDAIFADPDLSSTVDGASLGAATVYQGREDNRVYCVFAVQTEEVF